MEREGPYIINAIIGGIEDRNYSFRIEVVGVWDDITQCPYLVKVFQHLVRKKNIRGYEKRLLEGAFFHTRSQSAAEAASFSDPSF